MLTANLVGIILVALAAASATAASGRDIRSLAIRASAVWIGVAAAGFLIPLKGAAIVVMAMVMMAATPPDPKDRVRLFLMTMFAMPQGYAIDVPFPGVNYLLTLNVGFLATLIFLTPFVLGRIGRAAPKGLAPFDALIVLYLVVDIVLSTRETTLTDMARYAVTRSLAVWLPYFALTRMHETPRDVERTVQAMLHAILILAAVCILSLLRSWNFYAGFEDHELVGKAYYERRNGLLRVSGTLAGPLTAALMGLGVAALMARQALGARVSPASVLICLVLLFVAFATGSRGGMAGCAMIILLYLALVRLKSPLRAMVTIGFGFTTSVLFAMVAAGALKLSDAYGTFDYRAELARVGVQEFFRRPIFGSPNITAEPAMQALIQGEGIIDLVNIVLIVGLEQGLVGLFAFFTPFFLAISRSMRVIAQTDRAPATDPESLVQRRVGAMTAATLIGMLVMGVTTSFVSYIEDFFFIFTAIGLALPVAARGAEAPAAQTVIAQQAEPATSPGPPESQVGPRPYGARFVRHR